MIKNWLAHPLTRGLDLDSPETTALRRRIIQSKPFLKKIYDEWYSSLLTHLGRVNLNRVLEVGSGAGYLAQAAPGVVSSDLLLLDGIDIILDAQQLPLASSSLEGVTMVNVLHHIPNPEHFFSQASRVLAPGAKIVLIEPWLTPWSRWVYRNLHHEPIDEQTKEWKIQGEGPLSGANSALPWIFFHRDKQLFANRFPQLEIEEVTPFMPLRYLLSGGISMRNLMPSWTFGFWRAIEQVLSPLRSLFSMFVLIRIRRR